MTDTLNWKHLNFSEPTEAEWIRKESGVDSIIASALIDTDSRPRTLKTDKGVLVILRGVNLNPDSDIEDMISVRVWIEEDRIISTSRRRLNSISEIQKAFESGRGPETNGEFITLLARRLSDFITQAIDQLEESLDQAEDAVSDSTVIARHSPFTLLRRQTARIRRYISPQKEALDQLSRAPGSMFSAAEKANLAEQANRLTLIIEDLDLVRERALVAQEEFLGNVAHEQNSRMLVLSIVAAIFLPLSFLTGLMGMNVAGLPGLQNHWAFWILVILMLAVTGLILYAFRRKRWL